MTNLKTLYLISDESCGEIEGIFDTKGKLLGGWDRIDAVWREENFAGLMAKLGYSVKYREDPKPKLVTALKEHVGADCGPWDEDSE